MTCSTSIIHYHELTSPSICFWIMLMDRRPEDSKNRTPSRTSTSRVGPTTRPYPFNPPPTGHRFFSNHSFLFLICDTSHGSSAPTGCCCGRFAARRHPGERSSRLCNGGVGKWSSWPHGMAPGEGAHIQSRCEQAPVRVVAPSHG
jgi:hypothetical protein